MSGTPGLDRTVIPPGATIGMLGGGQLGRMTALAAARLGYRTHVFCDDPDSPCAQVAAAVTVAPFEDRDALAGFAAAVDVITLEWENIPVETVKFLTALKPVRPDASVLAVTQDRRAEKDFANRLGIATAPWRSVATAAETAAALASLGAPALLKTARLGYDGKGQVRLDATADVESAWAAIGSTEAIVEGVVDFACEVSVIVARGLDGAMASYPAVENHHRHQILAETRVPAAISPAIAAAADRAARQLTVGLGVVGLLAVEMFVTQEGAVLINELAPRPHNSGHWTIDAGPVSQFEQLVRAVCGLPLGSTERFADAVMENLIGSDLERWPALVADPTARLHLYGKHETRPGRKMGHVTHLRPRR